MAMSYKFAGIGDLPVPFDFRKYRKGLKVKKNRSKLSSMVRNAIGFLMKANRDVIVPADDPLRTDCFRAKRILNYDENTHKGFVTEKSVKEAWRLFWRLIKTLFLIDKKFKRVVNSYREQYPSIITEEFWREYLEIKDADDV
jgi:hypothetical protein